MTLILNSGDPYVPWSPVEMSFQKRLFCVSTLVNVPILVCLIALCLWVTGNKALLNLMMIHSYNRVICKNLRKYSQKNNMKCAIQTHQCKVFLQVPELLQVLQGALSLILRPANLFLLSNYSYCLSFTLKKQTHKILYLQASHTHTHTHTNANISPWLIRLQGEIFSLKPTNKHTRTQAVLSLSLIHTRI